MDFDDQEVSVHNESTKRNAESHQSANNEPGEKKTTKKRRSSLATTRRSITGDIVSHDFETRFSIPPYSQTTSTSSNDPGQDGLSKKGLKPNPANLKMDEIISKYHNKINALNQEYEQWKEALRQWDEQEERSAVLRDRETPLMDSEIPEEFKDMARREFMTETIDFASIENGVEKSLRSIYINMGLCMKDLHLFREIVYGIEASNKIMNNHLSPNTSVFGGNILMETGKEDIDVRNHIEHLLNDQ